MGWSLLWVLTLAALADGQKENCLSGDDNPYLRFGTKTAYIFANRGMPNSRTHDIPGCTPIAFWSLNRHGSHNPEADELANLQKLVDLKLHVLSNYRNGNYRNLNEKVCPSDLNLLEKWQWNPRHNLTFAGALSSAGYMETQRLAQAWAQKFPGLLTNNIHDYMIKYSSSDRLKTTYRAYFEGIFRAQAETMEIVKEVDDKLLAPHKSCNGWIDTIEKNNDTLQQKYIFESKREYKEMISNISQRLGFSWDIHYDIILNIYQMCRYNKAWEVVQISPWCAAFTREDLRRLEYVEDLETYYKYGYGSPLNQKIGCNPVKDMMTFFTNHIEREQPQQPRAMIYFTEHPTILMTLAAMGVHRDNFPLTGDNYHTQGVQSRKWMASTMSPFNANIAAALYKCTTNGNFHYDDRYQVLFLENERTMNIPDCNVGLCNWSFVKSHFGAIADNCDINDCNGAARINGALGMALAVFALVNAML